MKKFLSLVLALIMTMSLVTISAGATEYRDLTDKDEIQYEEAVAVLNRIGVITGYEDGSFRPEGELTRGAAAKIIVSLLIGPDAAANLPNTTAPYPDVPASHTFAGVISYCKTAKIISGYGDGTFKPGNSLTGFAFAKMLLGALGYKQEIEGFVDTGWTMNVAKVGNVTGLFDRLDFDGAAAVNRETACQLALNTLKATMVTYGGTTLVTGAQALAVQGTQAMYVTSNNREINANINRRYINATNNEMTLEFGEEHFKDLRLEHDKYDPAYDDFGHPSNEWSYKKVTIGTFKLPADFTYTTQMAHREDTAATKEKALDLRNYDTFSTDHLSYTANWSTASSNNNWNSPFACATQITINGYDARVLNADYKQGTIPSGTKNGNLFEYDAFKVTTSNKEQAPSLAEICDLTDNGVTVEVYVCPVDADFITNVVVTRTQLMKVKRLGSDYVTLDRIDPDSHDPRGDGDIKAITGYNAFAVDVEVEDVKDNNYDPYKVLKDLKAGDYVAVVPFTPDQGKTYEVGKVYVPETISGRLTDVGLYMNTNKPEGNAITITVGGTKYVINEWNLDMMKIKKAQINATRKDVTSYLAEDGTVLWTTEVGNSDAWMIVGEYYQATNSNGRVVWWVKGWTLGGEQVELDLGTIRDQAEKYAPGELVHYILAEGGTGEYALEKPNYKDTTAGASQKSFWYSHSQDTADNKWFGERALTKTVKNAEVYSGEGVYNVAQYVKGADGENKAYTIHPANSLIPLEDYYNYNKLTKDGSAVGGAIFAGEVATKDHEWDYTHVTYKDKGVKFIYVTIAPSTGNVDYISVRKDAQNVSNEELAGMNTTWNNVATHGAIENNRDWVISPAEAYVNKDGNVEAVVIKAEPAVADLSNVVIITKVNGIAYGKNVGAEEVSVSNANSYEYVQGPNFDEPKVGIFKYDHKVGDILVIRNIVDDVMDCKTINDGVYDNRNPDAFKAAGVDALVNTQNKESKIAFYVGPRAANENKHGVYELRTGNYALTPANDVIMTNKKAEGELDELATDYKGLIKVSSTKWIDLRATQEGGPIEGLGDLLDYDRDTIDIRVLVNGKDNSDGFRRAYAIAVMNAVNKKNDAGAPHITISALKPNANGFYNTVVQAEAGGLGTSAKPYVFKAPANSLLQLTANYTVTGVAENAKWTVVKGTANIDGNKAVVAVPASASAAAAELTFTVTNHDNTVKDNPLTSKTVYVKVVAAGDATAPGETSVIDYIADGETVSGNAKLGAVVNKNTIVDKTAGTITPVFTIQQSSAVWTDTVAKKDYANWVPAGAKATITYNVYGVVDGKDILLDSGETTTAPSADLAVGAKTTNALIANIDAFKVDITGVTWDKVGVKYDVDATKVPAAIANGVTVADDSTKELVVATANAAVASATLINVKVVTGDSEGDVTGGGFTATVAGFGGNAAAVVAATDVTDTSGAEITKINQHSSAGTTLDGTRPVVVTVDATNLTTTAASFTLTGKAAAPITGTGIPNSTNLTLSFSKATAGRETVVLTATLSNAIPFASDPVKVTVDGKYEFIFPNDNSTRSKTVDVVVSADIDLSSATAVPAAVTSVTPVATKAFYVPAGTSAGAGDTITVTFNVALAGSTADKAKFVPAKGTASATDVVAVTTDPTISGDTVTITTATHTAAQGNTLTIAAGTVRTAAGYYNKTAIVVQLDNIPATTTANTPIQQTIA